MILDSRIGPVLSVKRRQQTEEGGTQQHHNIGPGDLGSLENGIGGAVLDPAGLGPQGVPALHGQGIQSKDFSLQTFLPPVLPLHNENFLTALTFKA